MIRKRTIRGGNEVRVTFVLPGDQDHSGTAVVGTFNDWDPAAHPFVRRSNGTFSVALVLTEGARHLFRYRTPDGHWFNEAGADGYEASGRGSDNCVLQL